MNRLGVVNLRWSGSMIEAVRQNTSVTLNDQQFYGDKVQYELLVYVWTKEYPEAYNEDVQYILNESLEAVGVWQ